MLENYNSGYFLFCPLVIFLLPSSHSSWSVPTWKYCLRRFVLHTFRLDKQVNCLNDIRWNTEQAWLSFSKVLSSEVIHLTSCLSSDQSMPIGSLVENRWSVVDWSIYTHPHIRLQQIKYALKNSIRIPDPGTETILFHI